MQNSFRLSLDKMAMIYKIGHKHEVVDFDSFDMKMNETGYFIKEQFKSTRYGTYEKNYTYLKSGEKEGSIYIGFNQNDPVRKKRYIKIEYNPNKAELPYPVGSLINQLDCKFVKVQSIDIALDFDGLSLDDYRVNTRGDTMVYSSGINKTFYVRPKGEGRIKIYDKTKERAKLGIEIPQTLRVELTMKEPDFFRYNTLGNAQLDYIRRYTGYLSEVSVRRRSAVLPACDIEYNKVILYLLNNVDQVTANNAIALMSVNKRSVYRDLMSHSEFEQIQIDDFVMLDTLTTLIRREVPKFDIIEV